MHECTFLPLSGLPFCHDIWCSSQQAFHGRGAPLQGAFPCGRSCCLVACLTGGGHESQQVENLAAERIGQVSGVKHVDDPKHPSVDKSAAADVIDC